MCEQCIPKLDSHDYYMNTTQCSQQIHGLEKSGIVICCPDQTDLPVVQETFHSNLPAGSNKILESCLQELDWNFGFFSSPEFLDKCMTYLYVQLTVLEGLLVEDDRLGWLGLDLFMNK